jgi:hypothetical protein
VSFKFTIDSCVWLKRASEREKRQVMLQIDINAFPLENPCNRKKNHKAELKGSGKSKALGKGS